MLPNKVRAPRNRTITLSEEERSFYQQTLRQVHQPVELAEIVNQTIHQDILTFLQWMPTQSVDLLFLDPPYNLTKTFNDRTFKRQTLDAYAEWLDTYLTKLEPILKVTASIYLCANWQSSPAVFDVVKQRFQVRNRITWEREKGRGAAKNWKNASEDIWFCTVSDTYTFNVEAVKLKRKVMAPYTMNGNPKDWGFTEDGNVRLTHPSNLWTDLTIPFWSMPENTDHPTQKPEKLVAKIILASSKVGDVVFDPFLGSGTTSVVAKKLGRQYIGVELDELYCCLAEKRLALADADPCIQGYADGVFWERNSLHAQPRSTKQWSAHPTSHGTIATNHQTD
ncbi:MAG: site-specific DNA-methyltransferase [Lyngbya sp. HA4199-MV5]|jgi:site-specific DNA-methyltransferase (adenine-specific)|nr:site-specific DNA-methyltransferase [Lyngbya sp. HA4199-MV5]